MPNFSNLMIMQKFVCFLFSMVIVSMIHGQSNENYIKTYKARVGLTGDISGKTKDEVIESYQYFNGLGKPKQSIIRRGTPTGKDLITQIEYDKFGRKVKNYLPYEDGEDDGYFRSDWMNEVANFYSATGGDVADEDTYYYEEKILELSPMNRPDEVFGAGTAWRTADKPMAYVYRTNMASEVRVLIAEGTSIDYDSDYGVGELYVTKSIDENGTGELLEFKNKTGQIVLRMVKESSSYYMKTYYVYDDLGLLRYVIQPMGVKEIEDNSWAKLDDPDFLKKWVFCYEYDERKRMIARRVPGSDWAYMVYDKRDRLVLTQSGNERRATTIDEDVTINAYEGQSYLVTGNNSITLAPGFSFAASSTRDFIATTDQNSFTENDQWIFTKYDHLNRPVMTGIYESNSDRATLQSTVNSISNYSEEYTGSGDEGYNDNGFPVGIASSDLLTVTYYDDYNFTNHSHWSLPGSCPSTLTTAAPLCVPKNQITGTKVRVLGGSLQESLLFYDDRYRLVKTISENHLSGMDSTEIEYFSSVSQLEKKVTRYHDGLATKTIKDEYTYDHLDRVETVKTTIDSDISTVTNTYNDLGELISKNLSGAQTVDYSYNIRGWLERINNGAGLSGNDRFGLDLRYTNAPTAQYNGNIGQMRWKRDNVNEQGFTYSYDLANRLTDANYFIVGTTGLGFYDVDGISYDKNGNITGLTRKMNNTEVDILDYDYTTGNQLSSVKDDGTSDLFEESASSGHNENEYIYDANGNMIRDLNKDIININYNYLNLPERVEFGSGDYVEYTYDAVGTKLKKVTLTGSNLETTHYLDGLQYTDTNIDFVQVPEGRFLFGSGYEYNLTDHLGNLWATVSEGGTVIQKDDYYPFGLTFNSNIPTSINLYKYNSKELQGKTGWYDYGARMYMPDLGRFTAIDPWADEYKNQGVYDYTFNNPVRFTDFMGFGPVDEILQVTSTNNADVITEITTQTNTTTRTVENGSDEYIELLGKSTITNANNGIGDEITVTKTTTTTVETSVTVEYDDQGNVVSRSESQLTTIDSKTNVTVSDLYGGEAGGFSNSSSTPSVSNSPTLSSDLSSLTGDAISYRETNGVSMTNNNEYAAQIAKQRNLVNVMDKYTPAAGALLFQYGSGPSLIFSLGTMGVQKSLERGLQTLENLSPPCNNCTKQYNKQ